MHLLSVTWSTQQVHDTYTDKQICDMERTIIHELDNRLNKPYADHISASIILIIQFF